ncbi:MAG: flap endonuclease [Crenarchaeota archaeon 13_1_40CM_2_52_14]|nr:MAG: flap endonuclease [Crenarchaeota archaeon 13_1_40CM_3_52_17]OLD34432.1 MAG: flap endonuclease [Crenarchaeota archaeon 13_1_40CM_2_52_14]OLE68277.1 MAG: flap endonuclease [archaeon 13_1_20CM_2_51_12]
MDIYLVDGTYELFRHFYAIPTQANGKGEEIAATRGVLNSIAGMLESGIRHIGVATDHVIESFRNNLWAGYKTSEGVDPRLLSQFPLLEEAMQAMGVVVWPMVELEADDALAGAAASLSKLPRVGRVYICTPDKDLAQCVRDNRIVQLDRRARVVRNEAGVKEKFGVPPSSIPDYLALVGDDADGYPGLEGWGDKSTAIVLGIYKHLEAIPPKAENWKVQPRSATRLAEVLETNFNLALLFRDLATLRTREPKISSPEEIRWTGPRTGFPEICKRLDDAKLVERVAKIEIMRATKRRVKTSRNPE